MQDFYIILLTIILSLILGLGSYVYFYRRKKQMEETYLPLYNRFMVLSCSNKILLSKELLAIGEELVYHPSLTGKDLNRLFEICKELELKHPEIQDLRLKAYNKKLHFDRYASSPPF